MLNNQDSIHKANKLFGISSKKRLSVLLVSSRDSPTLKLFKEALIRCTFFSLTAFNASSAIELSTATAFDIILIDAVVSDAIPDAKELGRELRSLCPYSVIVAVRDKSCYRTAKSNDDYKNLLEAGFNWDFTEWGCANRCYEFLLCLQKEANLLNEIPLANAFLTIIESFADPIVLTNLNFEIQYVNNAFEKAFGFGVDESIGSDLHQLVCANREATEKSILEVLENSTQWEGHYRVKTKIKMQITMKALISSIFIASKLTFYAVIMRDNSNTNVSESSSYSAADNFAMMRRASMRTRSRSLESSLITSTTIQQLIEILKPLQSTPMPIIVSEGIDKALEIIEKMPHRQMPTVDLKSSLKEDEVFSDLIGGLTTNLNITSTLSQTNTKKAKRITLVSPFLEDNGQSRGEANTSKIKLLLDKISDWDFDIITLEELTHNKPLLYAGLKIFQSHNIHAYLKVDIMVVKQWLEVIEANYHRSNSYHNSTHAADVLQCSAYFCRKEKLSFLMDDMDITCALIAAAIHDLDHPGRTNSFLINAQNKLAQLYNDISPLENHHVALAYRLTVKNNTVNIFQNLSKDEFKHMRLQIVDLVLATDMTKHFEHLNRFNDLMNQRGGSFINGVDIPPEDMMVIKRMVIKCSDISNPVRPLQFCKIWATRIAEEYFRQTDEEKKKGLPVIMPIFDRDNCNMPKTQLSFLNFFIKNMYAVWSEFLSIDEIMICLAKNYEYWSDLDQELST